MEEKQINSNNKLEKQKVYKKWWFWGIILLVFILIMTGTQDNKNDTKKDTTTATSKSQNSINTQKKKVTIIDFSNMPYEEVCNWCKENNINVNKTEMYSDTVEAGKFISQSVKNGDVIKETETINIIYSLGKEPSVEFKNALKKANSYANNLNMSKQAVYDQLISEYGEKFPVDAAQYAIDNTKADWKANALEKAKSYQERLGMSKQAVYDQLISEYGEKFTKEEAQYAIDNLK